MVVCLYIPCDGSSFYQKRVESNGIREFMDEFIDTICTDCSIVLLGDFNARTGSAPDYIIDANNQHIDIPDWLHDSFDLPRNSRDIVTNTFGYDLLDLCKQCSVHMMNGRREYHGFATEQLRVAVEWFRSQRLITACLVVLERRPTAK